MILPLGAHYRGVSICATMRVASCHDRCAALGAVGLVGVLAGGVMVAVARVFVV